MTLMNSTAARGNVYRAPCRIPSDSFDEAKLKDVRNKEPKYATNQKGGAPKNLSLPIPRSLSGSDERTVRAVIPTTHLGKVEIPEAFVEPTAGKAKYTSTNGVGQDFSVCVKHMKGECSMGQNCRQLHVAPAWFKNTDFERRSKLTCCGDCGEYNCTPELLRSLEAVTVQFTTDGNAKLGLPVNGVKFGNTKGFRERLAKAMGKKTVTIPVREVCRLHQNDECHFGNDCTRIHVCRSLATALNLPPVPRKNKVFAEETKNRVKKDEKEQLPTTVEPAPAPAPAPVHAAPAVPLAVEPAPLSYVLHEPPVRSTTPSPHSSPSSPTNDIWAIREDIDAWGDEMDTAVSIPQSYSKMRDFAPTALLPGHFNDISLFSEECTSPLSCVKKCIREVLGPVTPTVPAMGFVRAF